MATATDAMDSARTYLNDVGKQIWTDAVLLPYLKEAYRDLILAVTLNGLQVIKERSAVIPVLAVSGITLTLPSDFYEPIRLEERATGSASVDDFVDMIEKDFEPETSQQSELVYWAYRQNVINFVGATGNRDVRLFYLGGLILPSTGNSVLTLILAEIFLGPQTAGYAAGSVGNTTLKQELLYIPNVQLGIAGAKLVDIININVKNNQSLPAKRLPYGRGFKSRRSF